MNWPPNFAIDFLDWWKGLDPAMQDLYTSVFDGIIAFGAFVATLLKIIWELFKYRKNKEQRVATKEEADGQQKDLLRMVETVWIKGVLKKSLYKEVLIALEVDEKQGMVAPLSLSSSKCPKASLSPFLLPQTYWTSSTIMADGC